MDNPLFMDNDPDDVHKDNVNDDNDDDDDNSDDANDDDDKEKDVDVVKLYKDEKNQECRLVLWDGTTIKAPFYLYEELDAWCGDFEYLFNSPTFYEMKYDPWSFTPELIKFIETEFEPTVNYRAKRKLLEIESNTEGHFSITVHKNNDDNDQDNNNK